LKAIKELGFRNVLGSDPSPNCVRTAHERYKIPGLVGTVFTVPAPPQPHDFLILTGVMEHIRDLDRAISRFHELLSEAGRIYLEVPDASRYAPSADAPFQEFSVEHINFFSQRSLINLMHARGFRALAVGHVIRPLNEAECPCAYAVFEKCDKPPAWSRDTKTEAGLRAYIEGCQAKDAQICAIIRETLSPGEKMIVWGVGTHTLRLLATGGLDPANVSLFVDSNSIYQQQRLRGIPIVSPEELAGHREPILISSRSFQREIQNQIQNKMRLNNRLILLYES
jgi:methyltransferase family protein